MPCRRPASPRSGHLGNPRHPRATGRRAWLWEREVGAEPRARAAGAGRQLQVQYSSGLTRFTALLGGALSFLSAPPLFFFFFACPPAAGGRDTRALAGSTGDLRFNPQSGPRSGSHQAPRGPEQAAGARLPAPNVPRTSPAAGGTVGNGDLGGSEHGCQFPGWRGPPSPGARAREAGGWARNVAGTTPRGAHRPPPSRAFPAPRGCANANASCGLQRHRGAPRPAPGLGTKGRGLALRAKRAPPAPEAAVLGAAGVLQAGRGRPPRLEETRTEQRPA